MFRLVLALASRPTLLGSTQAHCRAALTHATDLRRIGQTTDHRPGGDPSRCPRCSALADDTDCKGRAQRSIDNAFPQYQIDQHRVLRGEQQIDAKMPVTR